MTVPKILTVVGARPQFVKASVVSRALRDHADGLTEVVVHTGQHYDHEMSGAFFEDLSMGKPDHQLDVRSGTHARQTAAMLVGLEDVISLEQPSCVLVYGDTNSTLAATLAAVKMGLPVAHVEAGLRCHDLSVPEEVNRVVTDRLSIVLYSPSNASTEILHREGAWGEVVEVGDVMLDAFLFNLEQASSGIIERLGLQPEGFALATIHRAHSTDSEETLTRLLRGLSAVAASGLPVVLPLHPRTKAAMDRWNLKADGVILIEPVGYREMLALEAHARVIATDSGGVQKEAYWASVPCVTLRPSTEWVETVEAGWNQLVDSDPDQIARALLEATPPAEHPELYGDGHASQRIAAHLGRWLKG